ncbi:HWE histidine kinase domain-containing protein [Methylobacterium iners]
MANARNAGLFGRSVTEMQGTRLSELGTNPEAVAHWLGFMRECYAKPEPTVLEYPFERDGVVHHYLGTYTPLPRGSSNRPRLALVSLDISERKRLEEQQVLVTRELHHRVKNTLAIVQALVSSTARYATTIAEFQQSVMDRIASLAKTHTLLIDDQWGGAALRDILLAELSPYDDEIGHRVRLEGPDLHLPSEAALAISMAAHELTTNAAKYGAFSLPTGHVHVAWTLDRATSGERLLTLIWEEHDGPLVQEPTRKGFGSVLLQRVLGRQLGGQVEVTYAEEGVRVRLTALMPQTH